MSAAGLAAGLAARRLAARRLAGRDNHEEVDFCCFLCNGHQLFQGYVTLHVSFVTICLFNKRILDQFEYSSVCSVNEEEPPTSHSLIITLPYHTMYLCHLLRKELLLRVFQKLRVYEPDVHLPAESLGFPTGGLSGGLSCSPHLPRLVYPGICRCPPHHHRHEYQQRGPEKIEGWEERFEELVQRYKEWKRKRQTDSKPGVSALPDSDEHNSSDHLSPS